jgi:hypothetical protein
VHRRSETNEQRTEEIMKISFLKVKAEKLGDFFGIFNLSENVGRKIHHS